MQDTEVYIPIFEQNHFKPIKTTLALVYKGDEALPYFYSLEDCVNWCDGNNLEIKKQTVNDVNNHAISNVTSLEYKLLNFKLKLHGVKLTLLQRECVLDAMKELTLQRKLGNFTNKMI